ncbi:uncharacterized protein LOC107640585 [Arachis ipaensis]|uniref:uncharacterized protein LOC107640585 n=1 Tax=Arachis ipaensis TaxID=130454 RepID=UPI0007AEE8A0|nr:uncharacterized protein LOC107640585 [Arachis ipaensis]
MGEAGCSTPTKDPLVEELKEIRTHEKTIEVPLNALLQIMESEEYSSSNKEEETKEEQVTQYLAILMKMNVKFCGTEALKEEPPVLTQECIALVQRKLPQKRPNPRSFLIPYTIEVQAANILLEIADRSLKKAHGMVKDVLVKVEDLYRPADFVILDTGEDRDESIILGRPFLATGRAMIDVKKGELVLQLNEDCLVFKVHKSHSTSVEEGTIDKHLVLPPLLLVQSLTEPPNTNSKFGVGQPSSSSEKDNSKKKVPKG